MNHIISRIIAIPVHLMCALKKLMDDEQDNFEEEMCVMYGEDCDAHGDDSMLGIIVKMLEYGQDVQIII